MTELIVLLSVELLAISIWLGIVYKWGNHKKVKKVKKVENPERLPCKYCGTEVSQDYIMIWSKGDFTNVVCGKKECLDLYLSDLEKHEEFTNDEKTNI